MSGEGNSGTEQAAVEAILVLIKNTAEANKIPDHIMSPAVTRAAGRYAGEVFGRGQDQELSNELYATAYLLGVLLEENRKDHKGEDFK